MDINKNAFGEMVARCGCAALILAIALLILLSL